MKAQRVNAAQLTDDQIFDLASYVMHHGVISINSPETEVSEEAEQFSFSTSFDSISVWVLNGWPVAAADEEIGNSWVMLPNAEPSTVTVLNGFGEVRVGRLVDDTVMPAFVAIPKEIVKH
ncbi:MULTISPECIES: hypothetical protein [Pectobacterium]|uniref:hypothetical protein n=1 Tax=Pectobacterium TaxID=122277 RepID=UPI000DCF7E36|nr:MULTISPECIES: hypothetical protein [Pectobacterium]AZS59286.1 hypothetical protein C5E18_24530 [Pectobacterium parmentieri]MCL6336359.1 hypothetical protein [Pectobacterium carotovorum subsp. carotovorum]QHP82856.1 hypothetical protein EO763_23495 [Pectobacterium odoriferum]